MPAGSLTVVALALGPYPTVAGLDHVQRSISSYLDCSDLIPLYEACSSGSIRLLDHIWENSDPTTLNKASRWSPSQYLRTDPHYHRYQFSNCLRAAVKKGDLELVRWILAHFSGCTADVEVVEDAAIYGRLQILQCFLEYESQGDEEDPTRNAISWGGKDVTSAMKGGHLDIAQWLYENIPEAPRDFSEAMKFAVRGGDMASIQWLLDVVYIPGLDLPPPTMNDAAAGGHMEILQWVYEQGYHGSSEHALEGAARNGQLDMVKWLVKHGITERANEAVEAACARGHLAVVRWLNKHRLGREIPFVMKTAIANGHLDVVKYLFPENTTFALPSMMKEAASNGHLNIVQWLYEIHRSEIALKFESVFGDDERSDLTAMDLAAKFGHFHVLKYLHSLAATIVANGESTGPTCSEDALPLAAERGHLKIVKWLHDNYPQQYYPRRTTTVAALSGSVEILQWLHDNYPQQCYPLCTTTMAARSDTIGVLSQWLHGNTHRVWTSSVMDNAAFAGHLSSVKWLHENRSEGCTTEAMDLAAHFGHIDVIRWLHYNRSEGCTGDAMQGAATLGHFEILLFLHAERTEGMTRPHSTVRRGRFKRNKYIRAWLKEHYPRQW